MNPSSAYVIAGAGLAGAKAAQTLPTSTIWAWSTPAMSSLAATTRWSSAATSSGASSSRSGWPAADLAGPAWPGEHCRVGVVQVPLVLVEARPYPAQAHSCSRAVWLSTRSTHDSSGHGAGGGQPEVIVDGDDSRIGPR